MSQTARFYVDGFLLSVSESAYLVRVRPANGETGRYVETSTLPDWIFRSSHAIWLWQEDAPLIEQARRGEEIKNLILAKGENHAKRKADRTFGRPHQRAVRRKRKNNNQQKIAS